MITEFELSPFTQKIDRGNSVVLYHRLFGNAIELPKKAIDMLSQFTLINHSDPNDELNFIVTQLVEKGHLIQPRIDERKKLENLVAERRYNAVSGRYVKNLQLNVSEGCNLACIYCIQQRFGNLSDRFENEDFNLMRWDVAKQSIDSFIELMRFNGNYKGHLMFFGGEPLINWEVITKSMDYITTRYGNMDISFVITSNGTLVTQSRAKILRENNVTFQVSLDGIGKANDANRVFKNGKGTYVAVDNGLKILAKEGVNVNLGVVISNTNIDGINHEFINYAIDLGVRNIEVNPEETLYKTLRIEAITDKLLELISYGRENSINVFSLLEMPLLKMLYHRQGFCSASGSTISVEPSGDIYLCRCLKERTKCISTKAGNIQSIPDILKSDYYRNMTARIEGNVQGCSQCDVEGLCGGGCAANAEKLVGDVYSNDSTRCAMIKTVTYEQLKQFGVRQLSQEGKLFAESHKIRDTPEKDVEKLLMISKLSFWDKDLVRAYLGHRKEQEYVPIRMIDF